MKLNDLDFWLESWEGLTVRTRANLSQNSCKLIFSARANSPEKKRSARANSISNRANSHEVCTME